MWGVTEGGEAPSDGMGDLLKHGPAIHIPLATPAAASTLLEIHGRGGIVRRHRAVPAVQRVRPRERFSSHECVGDISDLKPKAQRTCLFRRVCLDTRSGDWRYYRHANISLPPVLFERRYGSLFTFQHVAPHGTEEFVALNKHVRYKPRVRWSPIVVEGPAPADGIDWVRTCTAHAAHHPPAQFVCLRAGLVDPPALCPLRAHQPRSSHLGGELPTAARDGAIAVKDTSPMR